MVLLLNRTARPLSSNNSSNKAKALTGSLPPTLDTGRANKAVSYNSIYS